MEPAEENKATVNGKLRTTKASSAAVYMENKADKGNNAALIRVTWTTTGKTRLLATNACMECFICLKNGIGTGISCPSSFF
ncbi:hypothetical protein D3C75_1138110 [compost metagenome]